MPRRRMRRGPMAQPHMSRNRRPGFYMSQDSMWEMPKPKPPQPPWPQRRRPRHHRPNHPGQHCRMPMKKGYQWGPFKKRPNILILMTDQERTIQHFPKGWAEKHLPNLQWLKETGVTFKNSYCNTSPCGPSRAVMFTGLYQASNKVWQSGDTLPPNMMTMGTLMKQQGYEVAYKGKWHLDQESSLDENDRPPVHKEIDEDNDRMRKLWDFPDWDSPDAAAGAYPVGYEGAANSCGARGMQPRNYQPAWRRGESKADYDARVEKWKVDNKIKGPISKGLNGLGGGDANNDRRFVEGPLRPNHPVPPEEDWYFDGQGALEWLDEYDQSGDPDPFFLVVSLVNPHDIKYYPNGYLDGGFSDSDFENDDYKDFELPPNWSDTLETKPSVQALFKENLLKIAKYNTSDPKVSLKGIKFYAYLHTVEDQLLSKFKDKLEMMNMLEDTIIVRTADHGEMVSSHGMASKCYNMYQETVNVPMIFSNPKLHRYCYGGRPVISEKPVGLVDLVPTLARIGGWKKEELKKDVYLEGQDISQALLEPPRDLPPQPPEDSDDCVLYTFEPKAPNSVNPNKTSGSIRAVLTGRYKYAVYFSGGTEFVKPLTTGTPSQRLQQALKDLNIQYEMYDLQKDPYELTNLLYGNPPDNVLHLAEELHELLTLKLEEGNMTPAFWSNIGYYRPWF